MHIVVGLGNPTEEYAKTRHNTGRMAADFIADKVSGIKVFIPDTFMNKTGPAVAKVIKSKKAAQKLIVIHDDLDLPLGTMKISYNRGSGGHRGVKSIIKVLKTEAFIRIRIGISPKKKPIGPTYVEKHILSDFRKPELETLKKVFKKVREAVEIIVEDGLEKAMNRFN
ncbi:MAG: aminoacyl-tRNA hydrolase [Candidatus Zambryskibacteria bacterium]|nr:aminoacyl-tRNA hydrolase [Candidatus Zambryskibacteria bacterium]